MRQNDEGVLPESPNQGPRKLQLHVCVSQPESNFQATSGEVVEWVLQESVRRMRTLLEELILRAG